MQDSVVLELLLSGYKCCCLEGVETGVLGEWRDDQDGEWGMGNGKWRWEARRPSAKDVTVDTYIGAPPSRLHLTATLKLRPCCRADFLKNGRTKVNDHSA